MNLLSRLKSSLNAAMRTLREKLEIEEEWLRFQPYTRYLKVPFYVTCGFLAYPHITYHYNRTKKIILNYYTHKKFDP